MAPNKALTKFNASPLQTAESQVVTLSKVLTGYASWRRVTSLAGPEKMGEAKATLIAVREIGDTAEKGRKALTAPLLAEKKAIDAAYFKVTDLADQYDQHLVKLLTLFDTVERSKLAKVAERDAKRAEKVGAEQLAADIRAQVEHAPIIEGNGLVSTTIRRAKVVSFPALFNAVREGHAPVDCLIPNEVKLNEMARKGETLPLGVELIEEVVLKRSR